LRGIRRGEIGPADDALDEGMLAREFEEKERLLLRRRRLHEHGRSDVVLGEQRCKIAGLEVAVQRAQFGREPSVVAAR
jgi:hypothetical protein